MRSPGKHHLHPYEAVVDVKRPAFHYPRCEKNLSLSKQALTYIVENCGLIDLKKNCETKNFLEQSCRT